MASEDRLTFKILPAGLVEFTQRTGLEVFPKTVLVPLAVLKMIVGELLRADAATDLYGHGVTVSGKGGKSLLLESAESAEGAEVRGPKLE